ncbi:EcKinase 3 [Halyomorpha halys]|nr:EcKinase 3 [Halyomorpha halys]
MVDPDMEKETKLVEKYIADCYSEPNLSKILNVQATPAVPPGENFLSAIWRLVVKILLKNGEVKERNLILKNMPKEQERCDIALQMDTFTREIMTYELVLKKMDEIMIQFKCDGDRPWCNLILHNNYQNLLLEDLKPLGYEPADKIEGLTLQEAELIFKSLGRFHAASKAAVYHGKVNLSTLKPRLTSISPKHIEAFFVRAVRFLSKSIDESWGPDWKSVQAKLDVPADKIVNKMLKVGEVDETRFNAILHGDLWTNNILFQKDTYGVPKSVKFVDFQLSFYATVGWDLTYLAFTSLSYSLRQQHLKHLLKIYLDILQEDLRKYGYPEDKIPTYEYLLNEMKRLRFWGLITVLFYLPIILTGVTGNKEDAKIIMVPSTNTSQVPQIYRSEIFRNSVGKDILELLNEGVMD